MRNSFSVQNLLDKIEEAEVLVSLVHLHENTQKGAMATVRWFIVGDEATALIQQAEEHLNEEELHSIQDNLTVLYNFDVWSKYKNNPRRAKEFFGHELFER